MLASHSASAWRHVRSSRSIPVRWKALVSPEFQKFSLYRRISFPWPIWQSVIVWKSQHGRKFAFLKQNFSAEGNFYIYKHMPENFNEISKTQKSEAEKPPEEKGDYSLFRDQYEADKKKINVQKK
jgi:hypothetical protein